MSQSNGTSFIEKKTNKKTQQLLTAVLFISFVEEVLVLIPAPLF
jgi:hypothetical protein